MTRYVFDPFGKLYAERTSSMVSSEIRDLLSITARPDVISLAGGLPETGAFPPEMMAEIAREVFLEDGPGSLQYGPTDGYAPLKKVLCEIMALEKIHAHPEEIVVTTGAQQALEILAKIFINPGDWVVVEAPSYVGALNSFMSYQPRFITVGMDQEGLKTDILAQRLKELRKRGEGAKFLYTVPNFQNPAGITMSAQRRARLLEIAREFELLVIEDNAYGMLRFEGEPLVPLKAQDPENVVYLGTLSKILSAGLRIGWVYAPAPVTERVLLAKQSADLCTSSLTQRIAFRYFTTQNWRGLIEKLVDTYRERKEAMLRALEEFFPEEATWTRPQGGFFIWASLPPFINTSDMLANAVENKVAYLPGAGFYPDEQGTSEMRLAFCHPPPEKIWEGIERLSKVINRELSIARSLGLDIDKKGKKG